jgi:hypothetical protein
MDRRALGPAAPRRTFAALAALLAAGLTLPASQPRPAPARPIPAWSRSAAFRPAGPRAAGMVIRMAGPAGRAPAQRTSAADAAGGTVTETITSAYRTGR